MELVCAAVRCWIENLRPGTLEEMGSDPGVLHARNHGLIIVRITEF